MPSGTSSASTFCTSSPGLAEGRLYTGTHQIEYLGNVVLVMAYVVAVAFYLSLLSNFLLDYLDISSPSLERALTTGMLLFIAWVGYSKGLEGLERLESFSVNIQLAVIVSLVVGLAVFATGFVSGKQLHFEYPHRDALTQLQILAGALLVVQGFETSRFLGDKYTREVRVASMRLAQIISGVLYVVSVVLLMPVVQQMDLVHVELSGIIDAMRPVAFILPLMLMLAALMSQFSAAVADMGGGGGLLRENSHGRLSSRFGYVSVAACAILLVWAVDLLEIITIASRAFAAYYFLPDAACDHLQLQGLPTDGEAESRRRDFIRLPCRHPGVHRPFLHSGGLNFDRCPEGLPEPDAQAKTGCLWKRAAGGLTGSCRSAGSAIRLHQASGHPGRKISVPHRLGRNASSPWGRLREGTKSYGKRFRTMRQGENARYHAGPRTAVFREPSP